MKGANRRLLPDLSTYGAYEFYLNLFFLLGIEGRKTKAKLSDEILSITGYVCLLQI